MTRLFFTKLFDCVGPPAAVRSLGLAQLNSIATKQLHDYVIMTLMGAVLYELASVRTALQLLQNLQQQRYNSPRHLQ